MAFTWNSVSADTKLINSDLDEAKANVDALASNLGVSSYSWSEMPVASGTEALQTQILEIQNAVDYIDTNNVCSTHNASKDNTVNASKDSTVDASENTGVDAAQYGTNHASYDSGADNPRYTAVDSNEHGGYYSSLNYSVCGTQYSGVHTAYNASAK
jgi:hypothetical protein